MEDSTVGSTVFRTGSEDVQALRCKLIPNMRRMLTGRILCDKTNGSGSLRLFMSGWVLLK